MTYPHYPNITREQLVESVYPIWHHAKFSLDNPNSGIISASTYNIRRLMERFFEDPGWVKYVATDDQVRAVISGGKKILGFDVVISDQQLSVMWKSSNPEIPCTFFTFGVGEEI